MQVPLQGPAAASSPPWQSRSSGDSELSDVSSLPGDSITPDLAVLQLLALVPPLHSFPIKSPLFHVVTKPKVFSWFMLSLSSPIQPRSPITSPPLDLNLLLCVLGQP